MTTQDAIIKLITELKADPGYYESWKANIAMAFKDQASWDKREWNRADLHETANKAADHFLGLLTRDTEDNQ